MDCYLLVDFGSTYTKLTLVDIDKQKIVGRASSNTTVKTNVKYGYEDALRILESEVDLKNVNIIKKLACSSAAGGLKMIAIGITPEFTVEAARRVALGAGARLLKSYSYFLNREDIKEINMLKPDIILLTGGAEGGNTKYIIENAKILADGLDDIPVVVAGNSWANEKIQNIFSNRNINCVITENIMPDVYRINPVPAREVIRKIFMKQIIFAKGMEEIEEYIDEILMPTPSAVLNSAELLAKGTDRYKGIGDVMVVDIGGATTDIHTISDPVKTMDYFQEGLEEPFCKRTVEGDLGMRYSALSLYESVGDDYFYARDPEIRNIKEHILKRINNPDLIFEDEDEVRFDETMAEICVYKSVRRHCGSIRKSYRNGRVVLIQEGKDLSEMGLVVGTGGIIVNGKHPENILREVIKDENNLLLPIRTKFAIDKKYIFSAMGLLAKKDKNLAFKILTENLIELS